MTTKVKIGEVMHPAPHTIGAEQTVAHAKKEMAKLNIRHLPILEGGRCVGIISDRDLKLAYAVDGSSVGNRPVTEICTDDVYSVSSEKTLHDVATQMVRRGIGSTVIIDDGQIKGIFTTTDACRVLAKHF